MGEVYRARDTKLNRDAAIKILPDMFAADPDRLARFAREAQTLAALNHSNIAHVYGVLDLPPEGGSDRVGSAHAAALVMEFADGEDLSAVIARGPLPIEEAIAIARQIADALEAAHEQGIVHRDLKPANVKVTKNGTVKVLDFGLAKAMDPTSGAGGDVANSPTLTARATALGVILGTAAYMAPEQARGKAVDRRADVWAFGVVLFEMLTGRRAFEGDETSDVLAAVLRQDIDLSLLPAGTPPSIRRLLGRCLRRDRRERLGDMSAARLELLDASNEPFALSAPAAAPPATRPNAAMTIVATAVVTAALVGGATWLLMRSRPAASAPETPLVNVTILAPSGMSIATNGLEPAIALSATHVAFVAGPNRQLFLRPLGDAVATPVAGATGATIPAFSPDGRWLAFFMQKDNRLKTGSGI